jgi:methylenetetrahydrofolate dehydrogenase (NADP+)/methenyltetrahydrofolate cyclohydrolase
MILLDGKKTANIIKEEITSEVVDMLANGFRKPHLAAILVGHNGASETYINAKVKACAKVGFDSTLIRLDNNVSDVNLFSKIEEINNNSRIDGLIVQLPLPNHIDELKVTQAIKPEKDVDGFHPENIGRMALNLPTYLPATPAGILELLKRYNIETSGKHCVVIGRSHIVGSPISILLSRNNDPGNCTVTMTHSKTQNLKKITKSADILIVALGKAEFVSSEMVKDGVCIIDVGITRIKSDLTKSGWKLLGDVAFDELKDKCSFITPVPGGVGPMTIAMLLKNTLDASKRLIY